MPPQHPSTKPKKLYFFYGHRKPSQNRPTVHGGLFSNRKTLNPNNINPRKTTQAPDFDFQKWDPDSPESLASPATRTPSEQFFAVGESLSPIARYIVDSFRKHRQWGPPIVADLNKLRRVTPKLVAEVIKVQTDPQISSKFFHWAGKQKGYKHDFASYNAFTYCLNRTNRFRAADQLPELMQMQGKPPSEKQFEILIRMHADANRGLRVHYVYEKMKKFGIKPRVILYNRIMDSLMKTNHVDLALSVYRDFLEDGLVEGSVTFMILIKGLCKAGKIKDMFEILGKMRGNLCKPDVFAYTAMIRVLVFEGNLEGSLRVWDEMKRDNVEPDVMAYSTLIMGLCKGKNVEKGYELFKEMKKKKCLIDRDIYGCLIDAFVVNGKLGSACDLLKDLVISGYRADLAIYNSLIEGLCRFNHVDKAYKLFHVTLEEDLLPDFSTVNPILVSFAELKRNDDILKLLEQMGNLGFNVVDGLCKFFMFLVQNGDKDKVIIALELFEYLKLKGYNSGSIYNILLDGLYKIGETNKGLKLFRELKDTDIKIEDFSPIYSTVIKFFVKTGDIEEAGLCYNKIKKMNLIPKIDAYVSLVRGLCKIGELDAAMMLVRDCLGNVTDGPTEFKYLLAVIHVCKLNDAGKVMEVLSEMMERGCCFDDGVLCCAVIFGMCKNGTVEEARKVFSNMREREILSEADLIVYDEILIDHMKQKTADLVVSGLKFFGLESKLRSKGCRLLSS